MGMPEQQIADPAHHIVHALGSHFGYWWILGLVGLGALLAFKKHLKKWLE